MFCLLFRIECKLREQTILAPAKCQPNLKIILSAHTKHILPLCFIVMMLASRPSTNHFVMVSGIGMCGTPGDLFHFRIGTDFCCTNPCHALTHSFESLDNLQNHTFQ